MKDGSFPPKPRQRLNLTRLPNGSSLMPYVDSSHLLPTARLSATTFRARAEESGHSSGSCAGASSWLSDASGRTCQRGGGDPCLRLLRVIPDRYRIIERVSLVTARSLQ